MTSEASFIEALRAIAKAPGARGLIDDAAVLEIGGSRLVLTMDAIVEGVHFLADDPADSVAWKLVATNVSDLAAKGAEPRGCLLSYPLTQDQAWNTAFLHGLEQACTAFAIPLLGGDTVRQPPGSARSFSLVALGEPRDGIEVPGRNSAQKGDVVWVSSPVGDAGLGLAILQHDMPALREHREELIMRYRRPEPSLALGMALAPLVTAMMDVSDGVLIDAKRLALASDLAVVIDLARLPLSQAFATTKGDDRAERLFAASAGDDYCLMFTAPATARNALIEAARSCSRSIYPIGEMMGGRGLALLYGDEPVPLPERLGYEH